MPRPAPLQRFPVPASTAAVFPPVFPRPKPLPPATVEGSAVDKSGRPLAGVDVSVRGVGSLVHTDSTGRFLLSGVDANLPLFLRLSKAGCATTNTSYLNPRTPKENLRVVLLSSGELKEIETRGSSAIVLISSNVPGLTFTSSPQVQGRPGVGTTRFRSAPGFAAIGVTQISFQPSSPTLANDHEPNVIITASPLGRDMVMPVFAGQVTYSLIP